MNHESTVKTGVGDAWTLWTAFLFSSLPSPEEEEREREERDSRENLVHAVPSVPKPYFYGRSWHAGSRPHAVHIASTHAPPALAAGCAASEDFSRCGILAAASGKNNPSPESGALYWPGWAPLGVGVSSSWSLGASTHARGLQYMVSNSRVLSRSRGVYGTLQSLPEAAPYAPQSRFQRGPVAHEAAS